MWKAYSMRQGKPQSLTGQIAIHQVGSASRMKRGSVITL